MKLMDGKGRLFGKINIADFFIIVLIIVIIPAFLHIYSILGKTPTMVSPKWVKVEAVTFTIPEIAELFKKGDISYGPYKEADGRLINVSIGNREYGEKLKSVIVEKTQDSRFEYRVPVFLDLELACTQSGEGERYYYKREPLFFGLDAGFVFDTKKYRINCYAIKLEDIKK